MVLSDAAVLGSVGFHFGGLGLDGSGGPLTVVGSDKAINFFSRVSVEEEYRAFFNDAGQHPVCIQNPQPNKEKELMDLRHKVRQTFSKCWEKATGSPKVPYAAIKAKKVQVSLVGCPFIAFKDPSWYGKGDLRTVIDSLLSFDIKELQEKTVTDKNPIMPSTDMFALDPPSDISQTDTLADRGHSKVPESSSTANMQTDQTSIEPQGDSNISYMPEEKGVIVSEALTSILLHEDLSSEKEPVTELDAEHKVTEVMVENLRDLQQWSGKITARKRKHGRKVRREKNNRNIYQMERLLNTKVENNLRFFEVKWEGYEETTWEPEENIHVDIVKQFMLNFDGVETQVTHL